MADFFNSRVKKLAKGGYKWVDVAGQNNEMKLTRGVWVDKNGNVYATDGGHNRVLKYAPYSSVGKVVAGGNGYGSALNQLARPASVVVDDDFNIYIADEDNQRVVKWKPGAKSGILVAGYAKSDPNDIKKLNNPIYASVVSPISSLSADGKQSTILYISNLGNSSVEKWLEGASEGTIIAGGNGAGADADQLNNPHANYVLGNYLFIADRDNARIQRFDLSNDYVNNQFTATKPGNYSVTATFTNGSVVTSNTIKISGESNESSVASSENISSALAAEGKHNAFAYPNPVKNSVTINYSAKQNGKYIFELTELSGKILFHKEVNAVQGLNNATIDMSRFTKGIYFVNIISTDLRRQSIKLNKE